MPTATKTQAASLLSSFATLKSLSDAKRYQSPYQILSEFIRYIILTERLYSFSAAEMKGLLQRHFHFVVPEAVVKPSVKSLSFVSVEKKEFHVSFEGLTEDPLFEQKKGEAEETQSMIMERLSSYIEEETGSPIKDPHRLSEELISFLMEEQAGSGKYTEVIGKFILKHENDPKITEGLDQIRQGSILYIGLQYNITETGSITQPLTLYLSMEILFSLAGFNGTVHQQLAEDFYEQIRIASKKNSGKLSLHYFAETKREMDIFFWTAEDIVEGRRKGLSQTAAMRCLTNGAATAAEIDVKRSDFYYKLQYSYGVTEDPHQNYYSQESYVSNLESMEDAEDEDKNKELSVRLVSHIHKLREGKLFPANLESSYLIVTNTKAVLSASAEEVKRLKKEHQAEHVADFAVSLSRITGLLWYKLGNGFGKQSFPESVSVVLRARVVLSSAIAKNAERSFRETKKQYEEGTLTEDQLAARILTLRYKSQLPEHLCSEDIDDIADFSQENLRRYEEKVRSTEESLREKEELILQIQAENDQTVERRDALIEAQADTIRQKTDENKRLHETLARYRAADERKIAKKQRRKRIFLFTLSAAWKLLLVLGFAVVAVLLEEHFQTKFFSYLCGGISILGLPTSLAVIWRKDLQKYFPKELTADKAHSQK